MDPPVTLSRRDLVTLSPAKGATKTMSKTPAIATAFAALMIATPNALAQIEAKAQDR